MSDYLQNSFSDTDYDGVNLIHTLTAANDGLVSGQRYRFRVICRNAQGDSVPSEDLVLELNPLPVQLSQVTKEQSLSSNTSIMVSWDNAASETSVIAGYQLRMRNESSGETKIIYDSPQNAEIKRHLISGLIPGQLFSF